MRLTLQAWSLEDSSTCGSRVVRKWSGCTDQGVAVNCWSLDPEGGLIYMSVELRPTSRALTVRGWPGRFAREWAGYSSCRAPTFLWLLSIDPRSQADQQQIEAWLGGLPAPRFDAEDIAAPLPERMIA